ncbi:MAG: hypothetical protein R3183_02490 [Oleiphilaceae bacterium]|nr:hypothetical protein [Oleiphilaceae bacterium]
MSLNIDYWDKRRARIYSATGGWRVGDKVLSHGEDLLNDILPRDRYFEHLLRVATGKSQKKELARWVEAAFVSLSWPDPRIWCNTVGAFFGELQTRPGAATFMGALASDSVMYGGGAAKALYDSVIRISNELSKGASPQELVSANLVQNGGHLKMMGFSRPLATGDERVPVLLRLARQLGLGGGLHENAIMRLNDYLAVDIGETLNVGGYIAVIMADEGISKSAFYNLFSLCTMAGVLACYVDAKERPDHSLLPLRASDVVYTGERQRELPVRTLKT